MRERFPVKKKFLLIGLVGLVIGLVIYDVFIPSPWGRSTIPIISTGSFMLVIYGVIAKDKPEYVAASQPPPPAPQANAPVCQNCGGALEFIQQYNRWYCRSCQQYA